MYQIILAMSLLALSVSTMAADSTKPMDYKTLSFEKGVTTLSDSQKAEIKEIAQGFNQVNRDLDVTIASWSDEPSTNQAKSQSSEQQNIADERTKSIKNYMKEISLEIDNFETFNMAENPNFLAKTFNTKESKVKAAVDSDPSISSALKPEYQILKDNGEAGKSVMIVNYED